MKIKKRRLSALAVLALTASVALTACGSDDGGDDGDGGSGGGGGGSSSITMIPKSLGNPYFEASTAGSQRAAEEFGGSVDEVGPTGDAGPDSQVPFIQTATQQGVGALIVSANDPSALCDSIEQAQDVDIKVVTFDSDTECRDLFVSQADAQGIATKQIELIADQIGGSGDIAILSAAANATNQNEWIKLMEEDLAANYPDINLVDTVYGDDDDQKSFDETAALLRANPNLKGIVSPTTVGIAAAARYLSTSEFKGQVALTGLGAPSQMKTFIDDGTVTAFALWNPDDLGYLAAFAADALAKGDISGEEGDTFTAGDLGDYTVGADGVVVLGDPYVFDSSNIDEFDF
ncbi:rhamnose ABC transporter substrate-binding protein [Nocardioides dongxiaopingii]|uniref:rhamnose ABC transporter substrate-binding protein n=1 Tax=Nocardioides TaxID=1839 RepID=UPI0010C76B26|nr:MULTISPECIES: rhamnose ABC transporter substrate-binding protein [Nocardioides]QCW49646.1 rhamnose ABC transporter substrate-binding protein [Nocardioides sp. S-1144]